MSRIHNSMRRLAQMKPQAVDAGSGNSATHSSDVSVADQSQPAPPVPRRAPLRVRLSPEFINTFCFGQRPPDRRNAEHPLTSPALLFGLIRDAVVTVHAAKAFPASLNSSLSTDSFRSVWASARSDPEFASLQLVGWCAVRQAVALFPNEIDFHKRHFRRASDIALLVTSEPEARFTVCVYAKGGERALSRTGFCYAAQRVNCEAPTAAAIELPVASPIDDISYSRVYEPDVSEKRADRGQSKRNPTALCCPEPITGLDPPRKPQPKPAAEGARVFTRTQWSWFAAVLAIVAAISGGTFVYQIRVHPLSPASPPVVTNTELPGPPFNLELTEEGSRLRVSWDRRNPALKRVLSQASWRLMTAGNIRRFNSMRNRLGMALSVTNLIQKT